MKRCSSRKRLFLDRESAMARIKENSLEWFLTAYQCRECNYFHFTRIEKNSVLSSRRTGRSSPKAETTVRVRLGPPEFDCSGVV